MKHLFLVTLAVLTLAPMGAPASARLEGDATLRARLHRLVPAAFLDTDAVATLHIATPDQMAEATGSADVLGYYLPDTNDIYIRSDLKGYDRDLVVVHEYGHFVDWNELGFRERQAWDRNWLATEYTPTPTEYRQVNPREGWAEAFAFYCCGDEVNRHKDEDKIVDAVRRRLEAWLKTR